MSEVLLAPAPRMIQPSSNQTIIPTKQSICQGVQSASLTAGCVVYQSICQGVQASTGASQRR